MTSIAFPVYHDWFEVTMPTVWILLNYSGFLDWWSERAGCVRVSAQKPCYAIMSSSVVVFRTQRLEFGLHSCLLEV